MPRDGSSVYQRPAGTRAVPNARIESAKYNTDIDDLVAEQNNPRPIVAGGTGATSAQQARANLGLGNVSDDGATFSGTVVIDGPSKEISISDGGWWQGGIGNDGFKHDNTGGMEFFENNNMYARLGSHKLTIMKTVYTETTANTSNVYVASNWALRRSTSSGAYKINRRPVDGDIVLQLNPVSFESTHDADDHRRFAGFIAEEVAEVFPEASVDDGQSYDLRGIVCAAVAKIKSQEAVIVSMQARLDALEA